MKKDKKFIILVGILFCVAVLMGISSRFLANNKEAVLDINNFPMKIGSWQGEAQEVGQDVFDILETSNVLVRTYTSGDVTVYLAIVYYPKYKVGFHRPEACFVGLGSEILSKDNLDLKISDNLSININKLVFGVDSPSKVMSYFFKTNDYYGGDFKKFRIKEVINRIKMKSPGVAMIQISASVENNNTDRALNNIRDFTIDILPVLTKELL